MLSWLTFPGISWPCSSCGAQSISISGHDFSELVLQPRALLQLASKVSMFLSENVDLRRERPNRSPLQRLSLFTRPVRFINSAALARSAVVIPPTQLACIWASVASILSLCMAPPPWDPSLLSWPWEESAPSGSGGPSSTVGLTSLPIVNSHAESAAMLEQTDSSLLKKHTSSSSFPSGEAAKWMLPQRFRLDTRSRRNP